MEIDHKDTLLKFYHLTLLIVGLFCLYLIWPYISNVLLLLVLAFLFTTVLLPFVDWLEGKIKSRALAVLITVVMLLGGMGLFLGSFGVQLSQEAITSYEQFDKEGLVQAIEDLRSSVVEKLPGFAQNILESSTDVSQSADKIGSFVDTVLSSLGQLTSSLAKLIFFSAMLLIFTIIMLYEYHRFKRTMMTFVPNRYFEMGLRLVRNIEKHVSGYLQGQLLAATSVAILSILGLWLLNTLFNANLSLIIFIGIIAGIANLIPMVGPFAGMVPAILVAVMDNLQNETAISHTLFNFIPIPSPFFILDIILMFIIVQQIDNNLVTPKVVGEKVGMHPMLVIIALLVGANVMGAVGMLVAVPAAGIIRVVFKECVWAINNAHLM